MQPNQFPGKILWLASYPKSGNTWFRAFLTALMNEGKVEINELGTDGIFSARALFDFATDISSRDLYDSEVKTMMADASRFMAAQEDRLSIVKIHDAFEADTEGNSIIPEDVTHCALYFIRNPLDIAGSLANHMHCSIQQAVDMLNNPKAVMCEQKGNLNRNNQFRQYLHDWSCHVESWTSKPSFPVCVIRYEDMLENTFEVFQKAVKFVGWNFTDAQIAKAIEASGFEALSRQEAEKGFKEKARKSPVFFRSGKKGNWENELSAGHVEQIMERQCELMKRFGYLAK